jgi:hypothetical protein
MSKEFNSEADIRNFKNKMLLMPKKLLFQVNQMIESGNKEWAIENFLKREYKGSLGVPTPPTIKSYLEWYEARKKIQAAAGITPSLTRTDMALIEKNNLSEITGEFQTILDEQMSLDNKKELLERLIKKCIHRIKKIEDLEEIEGMTSSLEAVLGSYLREIHSITSTQLKLSGELQEETNAAIAKMVNANLYTLIQLVFQVIQEIVPDAAENVKTKLFQRLSEDENLAQVINVTPIKEGQS